MTTLASVCLAIMTLSIAAGFEYGYWLTGAWVGVGISIALVYYLGK